MDEAQERVETFGWRRCAEILEDLLAEHSLVPHRNGRAFIVPDDSGSAPLLELHLPTCLAPPESGTSARDFLEHLHETDDELGEHLIVLVQAGAAALGWWSDEDVLHQKVLKAYVVRGKGRAQTLYAKTKGKSRYGSRLRLQNAQKHLVEINERLERWWDESGPADRIFFSCPQRTWPELFATRPAPPFEQRDARLVKIPFHVHTPNLEELERVRRLLLRGKVIRRD